MVKVNNLCPGRHLPASHAYRWPHQDILHSPKPEWYSVIFFFTTLVSSVVILTRFYLRFAAKWRKVSTDLFHSKPFQIVKWPEFTKKIKTFCLPPGTDLAQVLMGPKYSKIRNKYHKVKHNKVKKLKLIKKALKKICFK